MRTHYGISERLVLRYGGTSKFPQAYIRTCSDELYSFLVKDAQEDMHSARLKA